MSGVKKATVSQNLSRALKTVNEGLEQCASMAHSISAVGRGEYESKKRQAKAVHEGVVRKLPADIAPFVRGETGLWESLLFRHDDSYEKASEAACESEQYELDFQREHDLAQQNLSTIANSAQLIKKRISGRSGYLDHENAQALNLCHRAKAVLDDVQQKAGLSRRAQQSRRNAFNKLSESENLAQAAQREYDRLINLAHDRQEKKRIAEENERNAKMLDSDLKSLRKEIESKDYKKFSKGRYSESVKRELDAIKDLVTGGSYVEAIPRSQKLKEELIGISAEIDANEQAWTAAKNAAQKALEDARAEMALVNKEDVMLYSGLDKASIDGIYSKIDGASRMIASESFDSATLQINEVLNKLRDAVEKSIENKRLAEQREDIAESIMQALCDCEYDTPSYYQKEEGNELSDLCVVAAAPGGVGDMRMRISLDGEVSFEVANIPEGHEQLCVDAVHKMQEKLAEDDVVFNMTNWGRAEDQNKVYLDVKQNAQTTRVVRQRQG